MQEIITANWKMYKTASEAVAFVSGLLPLIEGCERAIYLAVAYTAIAPCAHEAEGSPLVIGAQNMHDAREGAFTGEIAAQMLLEAGARFVLLGHSERRRLCGEDSSFINRKVHRALQEGLQPLVCVGETLAEREAQQTEEVLERQLKETLADVTKEDLAKIILAYEPVWAIGTGQTATPEAAQEVHAFLRNLLGKVWGKRVAKGVVIQYGGSVKPENAKELLDQQDINGLLVGGASLSVETFSQIVRA